MASSMSLFNLPYNLRNFNVRNYVAHNRTPILAVTAAMIFIPLVIQDYFKYLSYGPGGLPYNALGWLVTSFMRLMSREQLSTRPYEDPELLSSGEAGFLPLRLPERDSSRPRLGSHPVPQRQLSQLPSVEMRQRLITRFEALGSVAKERGLVDVKMSLYERQHSALFVSENVEWQPIAHQSRGEISHIHAGKDGSIHVVLHPKDCMTVLEKKWGQRHALSGAESLKRIAGFSIPINYVLVYAPRDDAELEVAMTIIKASIQYMTGSKEPLV
ncbi:hypothetical protein IQ06DRAFT_295514 [Phaeosphaeriaceae sp. SRC1lsM3a]|nr:hypothetical protein IQ06DRAFT_295514 [Stagonospora sp. SRC1lsM3a]